LIGITDDPGIKDALGFLMTREVAHQKSFEKSLYAIRDNFPPGKLPGDPRYASLYVNASQGDGDMDGPWNSGPHWDRDEDPAATAPVDGGDGQASMALDSDDKRVVAVLGARTRSNPDSDPMTGAELGGLSVGSVTEGTAE
jgi:Mn-containing catalase